MTRGNNVTRVQLQFAAFCTRVVGPSEMSRRLAGCLRVTQVSHAAKIAHDELSVFYCAVGW